MRRSPRFVVLALCGLLAFATAAGAQQGSLESVGDWIPIWRSPAVVMEGTHLYDAGQYELAAERMVCLVDNGTGVVGSHAGQGSPAFGVGTGLSLGAVRVVVVEGESTGCTGYVQGLVFYFRSAPKRARDPASPCWTTKQEMGLVKVAVDAGNVTEAREQSQKARDRIKECRLSPCFMTKEEGVSIKAAYAAGNSKLGKELSDRSTDRSNKCWGR